MSTIQDGEVEDESYSDDVAANDVPNSEEDDGLCAFPDWVAGRSFQTMSATSLYQFGTSQFTVSNYTCTSCPTAEVAHQTSLTRCLEIVGDESVTEDAEDDLIGQRVKMVVKTTTAGW